MRAARLEVRNDRHCAVSIVFYDSNKKVEQQMMDAEDAGADKSPEKAVRIRMSIEPAA